MKKIICTLFVLCACLSLTGCAHEHTAESMWSIGIENHWHACEKCGEQLDAAPHSFDENGACTVCTAAIYDENGTKEAKAYDDHGSLSLHITYDSDGNAQTDERYVYEYHDDGNVKNQKYYQNRRLVSEATYLHCTDPENGVLYQAESIEYGDFSTVKNEYGEDQRLLMSTTYDVNGKVFSVERYEYEFDDSGNLTRTSLYTDDDLVRVYDHVEGKLFEYDANGEVKLERSYVYDENGDLVKEVIHVYGRLDHESYYTLNDSNDYYVYKTIIYNENGEIDKEVHYDANGKEIK